MTKQWLSSHRVSLFLALISLIIALLGLPNAFTAVVNLSYQILFGTSFLLFILAEVTTTKLEKGAWTGFARLPVLLVWLALGLEAALMIVVLGSLAALIIRQLFTEADSDEHPLYEGANFVSNNGGSILATHAIYTLLSGQFPILLNQSPYYDLSVTLPALLAGSATSLLIYLLTFRTSNETLLKMVSRDILSEIILLFVALMLPVVLVDVGWLPFVCVVVLVAGQNIRQVQIERTQEELTLRMREISAVNSFGNAVTTQISLPSVLELVYRELKRVIEANIFFIALYDNDQNTLEYPLVIENEKQVTWQKHKLGTGLCDYSIREKHPISVSRPDYAKLPAEVNRDGLTDAQYMIAPLIVGMKTIGAIGMSHASNPAAFSRTDFELLQTIASQTSLAIRNAHLYDRTVRLADNLSVINQSLQDVMFNLDRNDALKTACEIARNVTRAQKAAIFLLQPHRDQQMKRVESVGFEDLNFSEYIEFQVGSFKQGPRVVADVSATSYEDIQAQAKLGQFQACLQVPLRSGNTVVGSLTVYHDEAYYYETPELNLLEMLANQITAALDNADLLQALELYAAEQAQLVHLSRISSVSLDLDRIISDVSDVLAQMLDMSDIEIALYYPERSILRIETPDEDGFGFRLQELHVAEIPEMSALLDPDTITALTVLYANQGQHSQGLQNFLQNNHYTTLAMLPMQINHESLGIILLGDSKRREFSDNDYRLLEMATHQITAQIHNARLHTTTQEALVQRLEELDLIEEISQQISQALDLELIIQNVLEAALQSTHADFAAFALHSDEQDHFEIIGREVLGDHLQIYKARKSSSVGVTGYVASSGKMRLIDDNAADEHYLVPEHSHHHFNSSLAVPLLKGEKVIGVLNLESKQRNFFTLEHAKFIKSLAGHAAISIDNASLLEKREEQIQILTRLRGMALDSLNVSDSNKMVTAILNTALMIFHGQEGAIYRYQSSEQRAELIYGAEIYEQNIRSAQPIFPEKVILKAAEDNQSVLITNIDEHDLYQTFEQKDAIQHRSMIAIPIVHRQEVQEVLCLGFSKTHQLTQDDLGTVGLLAVQAAGHLENAALNEAIKTSNDRMRAILDSTHDGIILLDPDGVVQDANSAATTLTNLPFSEHLQEPLSLIISSNGEYDAVLQQLVQSYLKLPETVHEKEFTFPREESDLHIKTFVYRVNDDSGKTVGRLLVLRDITKQKDLQDFHDRMQNMVLHDLRGPLSSIITSMYMALNIIAYPGDDSLEEILLPTIQVSLDSANDLLQLVETLRELPLTTEFHVNPDTVILDDLAKAARNTLTAIMTDSQLTVDIDVPKDETIYVDRDLVRRVIVNLLHNAAKFTPEDGRILIRADYEAQKEDYLRVQIADTGPGIPEKDRERIFGEGEQIEGYKPRKGVKGMGLGLNFCKLAVEAHGGRIWVEKEGPLSGACFAFTIPLTEAALNLYLAQSVEQ